MHSYPLSPLLPVAPVNLGLAPVTKRWSADVPRTLLFVRGREIADLLAGPPVGPLHQPVLLGEQARGRGQVAPLVGGFGPIRQHVRQSPVIAIAERGPVRCRGSVRLRFPDQTSRGGNAPLMRNSGPHRAACSDRAAAHLAQSISAERPFSPFNRERPGMPSGCSR
jgi:hypothetical protein